MSENKPHYVSDNVVILGGGQLESPETTAAGYDAAAVKRMRSFANEIVWQAREIGLSPSECFNACVNVVVSLIHSNPQAKQVELLAAVTEALCASLGGGSDEGRHPAQST